MSLPRPGDPVTLTPRDGDPIVLDFQRFATVTRVTGEGIYVTTGETFPPDQELGPLQPAQLLIGWRSADGWRWKP